MTGEATTQPSSSTALLLDNDLFFVAKVSETLKHAGYVTRTARRLDDFARLLEEARPQVALVNTAARGLDWRGGIVAARTAGIPVIAFGSHVDLETQEVARQAGASRVIANSKLASDLPGIVARTVRQSSITTVSGADPQRAKTEQPSEAIDDTNEEMTEPPR